MSLDICVTKYDDVNSEDRLVIEERSINWLRNPFGLIDWVLTNTHLKIKPDIYEVCNKWNYDESKNIDRKLFRDTVYAYKDQMDNLKKGYFSFNLYEYVQFVEPFRDQFERYPCTYGYDLIHFARFNEDGSKIIMPQEYFLDIKELGIVKNVDGYKDWYYELLEIADLLMEDNTEFYCDN